MFNTLSESLLQVPPYIKKGKQVEVTIEKRHLRVCYRDDKNVSQTVVDGNLTWDVNKEECMWSLVPAEHVHVSQIPQMIRGPFLVQTH